MPDAMLALVYSNGGPWDLEEPITCPITRDSFVKAHSMRHEDRQQQARERAKALDRKSCFVVSTLRVVGPDGPESALRARRCSCLTAVSSASSKRRCSASLALLELCSILV